ncbi:hypothetical protein BGZ60DRAFT_535378 [Tricladium varicosporioides]|nr:hypothetical protein BGZ60DRAFT_535378 [Hymenoscyphus varicosporioides]
MPEDVALVRLRNLMVIAEPHDNEAEDSDEEGNVEESIDENTGEKDTGYQYRIRPCHNCKDFNFLPKTHMLAVLTPGNSAFLYLILRKLDNARTYMLVGCCAHFFMNVCVGSPVTLSTTRNSS